LVEPGANLVMRDGKYANNLAVTFRDVNPVARNQDIPDPFTDFFVRMDQGGEHI